MENLEEEKEEKEEEAWNALAFEKERAKAIEIISAWTQEMSDWYEIENYY